MEKFDVVILSCKAYDLDMAIDSLAPALDSKGIVLPLLNGFAHLTRLDTQFGRERVLGGFAHISAILASEGEIRHLNDTHRLVMGSRSRAASPPVHVLAELLADSNMNFSLSENIESEMMGKYIFLATLAAATCTMRSAIGDILQTHSGKAFILGLFNECVAIANRTGLLPNPQQLDDYRNQLTMAGSTSTASMLRDLEQGRRIEADHILGDMVRRAEALGIDIPFLKTAYSHLQAYEIRKLCQ